VWVIQLARAAAATGGVSQTSVQDRL